MSVTDLLLLTGEIHKGSGCWYLLPAGIASKGQGESGESGCLELLPVPTFILAEAFFRDSCYKG